MCAPRQAHRPPRMDTVRRLASTECDHADGDGTGHDEGQGRVPGAGEVEEAEHLGRIGHAGDDEAEPEDQAGEQRSQNEHDVSLSTEQMACHEHRGEAGRP